MKRLKKMVAVTMAISSIMAVSATNVFAHHGGGHHNGGCGSGYYYQSSYSCPYGNSVCNRQGYCIDHYAQYYNNNNYVAPANTQQQSISTDELIKILEQLINAKSSASIEDELKKIVEANKVIEATNAAITPQAYVCPYGNELCNQYGYCVEGCQGCPGYCR